MKAQELNIGSEALEDFREKMDAALMVIISRMKEKKMMNGSVTGKINITMEELPDVQGEIHTLMKLEPEVSMNVSAKAKVDCKKQDGLFVQIDEEGRPVIGSCQIDIEDLMERMAGGDE